MLPIKKTLTSNDVRLYTLNYLKVFFTSFTISVSVRPLKQKSFALKTHLLTFAKDLCSHLSSLGLY